MRKIHTSNESIEILIGDLIFKLGKAHQNIHVLSQRVTQLEHLLHERSHFSQLEVVPMKKTRVQ